MFGKQVFDAGIGFLILPHPELGPDSGSAAGAVGTKKTKDVL